MFSHAILCDLVDVGNVVAEVSVRNCVYRWADQ